MVAKSDGWQRLDLRQGIKRGPRVVGAGTGESVERKVGRADQTGEEG